VDYGVIETVTTDRLAVMEKQFLKLPFQAILCEIWNLKAICGKEEDLAEIMSNQMLNNDFFAEVK
jgi:hypothetical protein